jgi:general secretion pathway protein D
MNQWKNVSVLMTVCGVLLSGCGASQFEFDTKAHISQERVATDEPVVPVDVPDLVGTQASLPELSYEGPADLFDVIVEHVSVRTVLLTLADQAQLNLDIDPFVDGPITLNARGQTIDQILDRVRRSLKLRIERIGETIVVANDERYVKQYYMTFPDLARTFSSEAEGDAASSGSGSLGTSTITVDKEGSGSVWLDLEEALEAVLEGVEYADQATEIGPYDDGDNSDRVEALQELADRTPIFDELESFVHMLPDAGLIIVYGNTLQQELASGIISTVTEASRRQVLLQATVVEISLNNDYQQGIDWSIFNGANTHPKLTQGAGRLGNLSPRPTVELLEAERNYLETLFGDDNEDAVNASLQTFADSFQGQASGAGVGGFFNSAVSIGDVDIAISLLDRFGDTRVVSSPRISTLNGQGALLKVVEDRIYFTVEVTRERDDSGVETTTFEVEEEVIPIGFVLSVYPQIGTDGTIILYIRPSVSRVVGTATPPTVGNPEQVEAGATGIPILSVKEIETLLLLNDGQTAVLGGLIEDQLQDSDRGVPGAKDIPGIGNFFKNKSESSRRVEYVIFVSANIVTNPSIYGDYSDFRDLLPSDETFQRDNTGNFFKKAVADVPRN